MSGSSPAALFTIQGIGSSGVNKEAGSTAAGAGGTMAGRRGGDARADISGQLSFFSAEATRPSVADLAGLLCAQGQVVSFAKTAARLSVVVDESWRALALAEALVERGIEAELGSSDEGHPLVRTAFRHDLTPLAAAWTKGAVKAVPAEPTIDGAVLRLWVLAAGRWLDSGYLLGLDPRAPDMHERLVVVVSMVGLPVSLVGVRGGGPGLRLAGRRRLARLDELIGDPPATAAERQWPTTPLVH